MMFDIYRDYKPTCELKWFPVGGNYVGKDKPLAKISGYPECGPVWFCLKQLWISDVVGEEEEWMDVRAIK